MLARSPRHLFAGGPAKAVGRRWCAAGLTAAQAAGVPPAPAQPGDGALQPSAGASPPALPSEPARVYDIVYKGPIAEDLEGGARYASTVSKFWSNVPEHVRASFEAPSNIEDAPKPAAPLALDGIIEQAKALVASTGLAPAHWAAAGTPAPYYGGQIALAPYRKGQTAAYNYPRVLVPRELAHRFPLDMYVDPVFATSDPSQRLRMRGVTLFPRLQKKNTLLLIFSGQPLSGLFTGLRRWLESAGNEFLERPGTQMFKLHCEEGWLNRRTHQLTKFHLRRQVEESELWTTFVYSGKWKWEYVHALHLYDKQLPVVLLLDSLGYVRWHAVGMPSEDSVEVFRQVSRRLANEKKSFT
uniref:Thioredoxin-like fold domain-containing protein n=1 Tax=Alexandrium monilatum TaxID=311494 RepID=A0A7S4PRP8_9DINO|mmetsp:Transcript_112344/g.358646  ORF Transcript_112344/g.358646 Transcript_112344/m.358646 type:complete len:355 (+) Transcript_112344:133-1197(+)